MAHARQEVALVGYSEELERKPLKFVEPIPVARICSACGNVPRLTCYLLCGHTLCEPCYKSCATTSDCVCPLDGEVCTTADVTRKEYPVENLLRRRVHCFHEDHGCNVVLPASQVSEHVRHDCQYHVTKCPTCSAAVLSRYVCEHLKSRCTVLALHAAPGAPQGAGDDERGNFVAFERMVEQRVSELDAKLTELSLETGSQSDKLVEFCHNVNHLNETLTEQFEALKRQFERTSVQSTHHLNQSGGEMKALVAFQKTIEKWVGDLDAKLSELSLKCDSLRAELSEIHHNNNDLKEALTEQFRRALDRNLAEINSLCSEKIQLLRTTITSALPSVLSDMKTDQRVVTGYTALKKEALEKRCSWSMSDKVYMQRYCMSWGILLVKESDSTYIIWCVQLHEGKEDGFLDWPFTKKLRLSMIQPETKQERGILVKPTQSEASKKYYSRPIKTSNLRVRFDKNKFESSDIEREGYVKDDELLLRFEMLL